MAIILSVILVFGFLMDGYAVFLRVAKVDGVAEVLAMAALVQYFARISNVIVIFALSYAFESNNLTVDISLIFFTSSLLGMFLVFAMIRSERFCNCITWCLRPALYFSFKSRSGKNIWHAMGPIKLELIKLASLSMLTNFIIVLAMFIPFGIASRYPEVRMTSVYFGQLMNFFATLLVFGFQDPISMRTVDGGRHADVGAALIYGRVASYFLASLIFMAVFLL
jgi:hypothetical protein